MISVSIWRAAIGSYYNRSIRYQMCKPKFFVNFGNIFVFLNILILTIIYKIDSLFLNFNILFKLTGSILAFTKSLSKRSSIYNYEHEYEIHICLQDILFFYQTSVLFYCLLLCGDIEVNSGPEINSNKNLLLCHWNVNSLSVQNFS